MKRNEVYRLIDEERDYQDSLRTTGVFTEIKLPLAGELLTIQEYVKKATTTYVSSAGETPVECLDIIRKIAAISVRCMEHHGAPSRNINQINSK